MNLDLPYHVARLSFTGQSEGNTVGLNLRGNMYIGGVDIAQVRVAPGVEVDAGFQGCISEVRELYVLTGVSQR